MLYRFKMFSAFIPLLWVCLFGLTPLAHAESGNLTLSCSSDGTCVKVPEFNSYSSPSQLESRFGLYSMIDPFTIEPAEGVSVEHIPNQGIRLRGPSTAAGGSTGYGRNPEATESIFCMCTGCTGNCTVSGTSCSGSCNGYGESGMGHTCNQEFCAWTK